MLGYFLSLFLRADTRSVITHSGVIDFLFIYMFRTLSGSPFHGS